MPRPEDPPPAEPDPASPTLHLARSARGGDQAGWTALEARLRPWLAGKLASQRLALGWTVDDVVNATLAEVFCDFDGFEPRGGGSFRAWVWTIAERLVIDLNRRAAAAKRRSGKMLDLHGDASSAPGVQVRDEQAYRASMFARCQELSAAFRAELEQLDDEKRTVVELHLIEELPFEDIARRIGRNKAVTVRSIYSRAMAQIRARLERHL